MTRRTPEQLAAAECTPTGSHTGKAIYVEGEYKPAGIRCSCGAEHLSAAAYHVLKRTQQAHARACRRLLDELDILTTGLSGFATFDALLEALGGYRPTIDVRTPAGRKLADQYDAEQIRRGDPRRAYRRSTR